MCTASRLLSIQAIIEHAPPRCKGALALRRAERRLVRALCRLKALERLGRVDVAERRVTRDEPLRLRHVEALGEHRAECGDLHRAEAGQIADALAEIVRVLCLRP